MFLNFFSNKKGYDNSIIKTHEVNDVKRYITLFSILVVFATMLVGCDVNRMGKDEYYVQITTDAKIKSGVSKEGNKYTEYNYELQGFDENGNEKQ